MADGSGLSDYVNSIIGWLSSPDNTYATSPGMTTVAPGQTPMGGGPGAGGATTWPPPDQPAPVYTGRLPSVPVQAAQPAWPMGGGPGIGGATTWAPPATSSPQAPLPPRYQVPQAQVYPQPVPMGGGPGTGAVPSTPFTGRAPTIPNLPPSGANAPGVDRLEAMINHGMNLFSGGGGGGNANAALTPASAGRMLMSPPGPATFPPRPPQMASAVTPGVPSLAPGAPTGPMGQGPWGPPGAVAPPAAQAAPDGHAQAAAAAGAASNVGNQVANNPDIISGLIRQLTTQGLANNAENAWLALAQAGFRMAASRSPFVGQALGEGASAGLEAYQQSRAARAQQMVQAVDLLQRAQTQRQQAAYQQGMMRNEQQRTQVAVQDLAEKIREWDIAGRPREEALTDWYRDKGGLALAGGQAGIRNAEMVQQIALIQADAAAQHKPISYGQAYAIWKTGRLGGTAPNQVSANEIYRNAILDPNFDENNPAPTIDKYASMAQRLQAATAPPGTTAAVAPKPADSDIAYLKAHPEQEQNFNARFGAGAATQYLSAAGGE